MHFLCGERQTSYYMKSEHRTTRNDLFCCTAFDLPRVPIGWEISRFRFVERGEKNSNRKEQQRTTLAKQIYDKMLCSLNVKTTHICVFGVFIWEKSIWFFVYTKFFFHLTSLKWIASIRINWIGWKQFLVCNLLQFSFLKWHWVCFHSISLLNSICNQSIPQKLNSTKKRLKRTTDKCDRITWTKSFLFEGILVGSYSSTL